LTPLAAIAVPDHAITNVEARKAAANAALAAVFLFTLFHLTIGRRARWPVRGIYTFSHSNEREATEGMEKVVRSL
jgi:hypothetical protein